MIGWPVLIAIVGGLMWALLPEGKITTIGMYLMICGMFWAVGMTCGDSWDVRHLFPAK